MSLESFYSIANELEDVFFSAAEGQLNLTVFRKMAVAQALMATCRTLNNTARAMEGAL